MTCGCSNSQYTLTVLYLMGLAGIEILSGLHHLLEIVSIRVRTLPLMDARCTLALPQMTFIWIIRPCRLLYYRLAFSAFVCLFSLVVLFLTLDFFQDFSSPKKKKLLKTFVVLSDCRATINRNPTSNSFETDETIRSEKKT